MPKTIEIRTPGPKGYRGMDEVTDPALLPEGVCALIQGLNPANGDLDGRYVGTGAALNSTAMGFKVYDQTEFISSKGKNYILGYTDTGKIVYTASDWSDWDGTQYVKLSSGNDLMFETTTPQGSTLITGAPHVKVSFLTIGNTEVIISNGMDDVYSITGKLNGSGLLEATLLKSDSTATSIENSNFPPFLSGISLGGRTIIHDGEVVRISAPGDDKRYYSTVEERVNGIWDDNDWCAPAAPGESSFITSRFIHIGGLECLITTTHGVYIIFLVAGPNGIPRLNILPVLMGAGCPTGACCLKWGTFYFLSDYNGGSWLGLTRGAAGSGNGEPIDIEAQNGWRVFEAAPGIATTLSNLHARDFVLVTDTIDTREDFESVPTGQRANVDCITNPGTIFINAKTKLTYTVGSLKVVGSSGLYAGGSASEMSAAWDSTYTAAKIYDNDPNKATGETAYVVNTNYGLINLTPASGYTIDDGGINSVEVGTLIGGKIFQQFGNPPAGFYAKSNDIWQTYTPKEILKNIDAIYLRVGVSLRSGGGSATITQTYLYIPILFSAPYNISSISVFDLRYSVASNTIRIGELYIEGISALTGTYISSIRPVANLTASTNLELGRLTAMFKKVNASLYPKVYVRGGSSATMDAVLSTTIATTNVAIGDSTITLASVAGVQVGDYLTTAATAESFYVKSISGTTITITGTFAYAHLIGAAVTIRGSVSHATTSTWSNWSELTLQQLYRGFDFRTLTRYGSSPTTYIGTNASGNFYWQFKVTLEIDAVTGVSPLVDRLGLSFLKGTLPLSNHLMHVAPDDSVILCAPETSASTENDISLILNTRSGGPWKVAGQHIDSLVQKGKDFYVNTGRKMAKLWEGNYNYIGTDSTNTALLKKIRTSTIKSIGFYWQKIRAYVNSFVARDTIDWESRGTYTTPGYGVYVSGNYAYIADYTNEKLVILNIEDKANPTLVGELTGLDKVWNLKVSGDYAYIIAYEPTDKTYCFSIVDISTPSAPALVYHGRMTTLYAAKAIEIVGNTAYIANETQGGVNEIVMVDITDPTAPTELKRYTGASAVTNDFKISGDYAYIAKNEYGLNIVDMSIETPAIVGQLSLGDAEGIAISDDASVAYLVVRTTGLKIVDISSPTAPALLGTSAVGDDIGIEADDKYVYIKEKTDYIRIVDISVPAAPVTILRQILTQQLRRIYLLGDYLYGVGDVDFFIFAPKGDTSLWVKCVDENGSATVFESGAVTSPDFKPFEGTPPMRGLIKQGYVEVEAYGALHMNDIETIIKPIY
jgi:hypothetical protein